MQRSRYRSSTSVALVGLVLAGAGCPGDDAPVCGTDFAATSGLTAGDVEYGDLVAGANNDCPAPDAPGGVVSVTIGGRQTAPDGLAVIALCLPRPDLIEAGGEFPVTLVHEPALATDRVQLVDLEAALAGDCRWSLDTSVEPAATATFAGFCRDPGEPFRLDLAGTATVVETCPGQPDRSFEVTLGGAVRVRYE